MSISPSKARALCTESEYNLVKWSSPRNVKTLTPAKLKDKIDRARKLRDKFRDLAKKQSGEARGKRKPTGTRAAKGNERTVMKAELFDQTLTRFQNALKEAETTASDDGRKKAPAKKNSKKTAKKSSTAKGTSRGGGSSNQTSKSEKKTSTGKSGEKKASRPVDPTRAAMLLSGAGGPLRLGGGASLGLGSQRRTFGQSVSQASAAQQSRETRRREASQSSKIGREDNRFSRTAREKIQGHVSSQTRRSQAKRDSKGG